MGAKAYFRGAHGLALAIWETYLAAPPGSVTAAKLLLGIANLDKLVSPPPKDYAMMDDAELNERVVLLGRKLLGKK
jgi:hypothetical protein